MANRTIRTLEKRAKFLETLKTTNGNVALACEAIGVGRTTMYEWRREEPELKTAWDEVVEASTDELEQEVYRRAREGVEKPVYYQGTKCGSIQEYSDTLAMFVLKARRPEKYRERFDIEIKDARKRAEVAVDQMMREASVDRATAIDMLKPHIPQISELLH